MRLTRLSPLLTVALALWAPSSPLAQAVREPAQSVPAPPLQFRLQPAGDVVLDRGGQRAEGSLPLAFVRSADRTGPDGRGRYLVAVNSGYGIQEHRQGNSGLQKRGARGYSRWFSVRGSGLAA